MIRVTLEFERDVMDPRFRGRDHVDHVVIAIAGQESRDALNVVGVPEAEKILVELQQPVALWRDDGDMSKPQRRHAGLLESWRGGFDRTVELEDIAPRRLNLHQFGDARLAVGLDGRGKTKLAHLADEIADRNIGL